MAKFSESNKFLCIGFLWLCFSSAEGQVIKFQHTYGGGNNDCGRSVQQTFDKGYIIAGATSSFGSGATDVYLIKTDSLGNMEWSKTFGSGNVDWGYSVQQTTDSGFVVAGYTNSFGNGGYDVYLIKTDSIGDTIWTKTYGGSNWDFGYSVKQTTDGGYIIAGGTYSFGNGNEDFYLIKTNSSGDTLWTKTFGGSAEDEARSVWQNTDGSYALAGYTESFGAEGSDYYYLKVGQNGDTVWTKKLGGTGDEFCYGMKQSVDGGFILIGHSNSFGAGNFDFYMVKTFATGDTTWTYRSGSADDKFAYSIVQNKNDGGYFFAGNTSYLGSEVFYWRTHPGPGWMWIWNGSHGDGGASPETAYSVDQASDGGFIMAGETESFGFGLSDIYLIKTNDSGSAPNYNPVEEIITDYGQVRIYPNPFNNFSTIELPVGILNNKKNIFFSVYDVAGRKLKSFSVPSVKFQFRREGLNDGIYFFRLEENSGGRIYAAGKLIIQ